MKLRSDAEILDWLERMMKRGAYVRLHISDSRDMGYRQNFISFWCDGELDKGGKGNSIREAISDAISKRHRGKK